LTGFPNTGRDVDILEQIVQGGLSKMQEAGCAVIGGHSVQDNEVKFGFAVTGMIHPDRIKSNAGAQPGDALVLTKRIGTGVISTALKRGAAQESDVQASVESMLTLNRQACEAMLEFEVHGCTDVTGFGLIGHAFEMARASRVTLEIDPRAVRFLPGAVEYARQGAIPGGLKNNREFASACVEGESEFADLLYDPQTSGGLLIALPERDATELQRRFPAAYRIGRAIERTNNPIRLL
jgi:selenide,water dikinase